jgi:hypothetical protein
MNNNKQARMGRQGLAFRAKSSFLSFNTNGGPHCAFVEFSFQLKAKAPLAECDLLDVCFYPDSDRRAGAVLCLLRAKNGPACTADQ